MIRRIPDVLHGVANSVKRLGALTQQFLHEQRHWRKTSRPDKEAIAQDLKQFTNFATGARWKNWYEPELEYLTVHGLDDDVKTAARHFCTLWQSHTALCQELLKKGPCDQQVVQDASRAGWNACRELGLEGTPWLHILFGHAWQYTKQWAYIAWCGNWGLEARHKTLKKMWRGCWRGGERRGSGQCAALDLLGFANAALVTNTMRFPKKRRRRQRLATWRKVEEEVRRRVRVAVGLPPDPTSDEDEDEDAVDESYSDDAELEEQPAPKHPTRGADTLVYDSE